jgi:glutathione S-transferase
LSVLQRACLIPQDKSLQARWLEWCFFVVAELDSTSLYVMRRHGTNNGLAHIYGAAPIVVTKAAEYFREQLRHVEAALADGRKYLMGDQFTTADIKRHSRCALKRITSLDRQKSQFFQ